MEFRYLYKFVPKNVARAYKGAKKEKNGTYSASIKVEKIPYGVIAIALDGTVVMAGVSVCSPTDRFCKGTGKIKAMVRLTPCNSSGFNELLNTFPISAQRDILNTIYGINRGKY